MVATDAFVVNLSPLYPTVLPGVQLHTGANSTAMAVVLLAAGSLAVAIHSNGRRQLGGDVNGSTALFLLRAEDPSVSGRVATAPASADGGDTTWTHSAVGDGAGNVYLRCSSRRRHGRDVRGAGTTTRQVVREVAPRRGGYQWPAGVGVPVAGAPSRVVVRMAPHSGHVYVAGTTGGTLYLDGAVFKGGGGGEAPPRRRRP